MYKYKYLVNDDYSLRKKYYDEDGLSSKKYKILEN